MNAKTVKLSTLRELVEAGSVRSAAIVGLPGGYSVQVRYGMSDRALAARTHLPPGQATCVSSQKLMAPQKHYGL